MKWIGLALMIVGLTGSVVFYGVQIPVYATTVENPAAGADFRQSTFFLSAALPMVLVFIGGTILFLTGRKLDRKSKRS